jgi:hypothetical protein
MPFPNLPLFKKKLNLSFVLLPVASLFISCLILSPKKYLRYDELLTFYLVTDKSFFHMLQALSKGVDQGMPLYYALVWFWVKLFGNIELSLRMFSCVSVCVACIFMYRVLARLYKFWPAFIGTIAVFCGSGIIIFQNSEARFYGLLLALFAIGVYSYQEVCLTAKVTTRLLLSLILLHGALVLSHVLGFWYSGLLLVTLVMRDCYFKALRPKVYLSIILGWVLFIPWIPGFVNQLYLIKNDFWITKPNLNSLFAIYNFGIILLPVLIIGLIFVLVLSGVRRMPHQDMGSEERMNEISLSFLAFTLLMTPALFWLISKFWRPFFIERYFMPSALAWCILFAILLSRCNSSFHGPDAKQTAKRPQVIVNIILVTISGLFLLFPIYNSLMFPAQEKPGADDNLYGYEDLAVVSAGDWLSATNLLPRMHYAKNKDKYFYLLDKKASLQTSSNYMNMMMAALKNQYLPKNILDAEGFMASHNSFLVLNSNHWLRKRITRNPDYRFKVLKNNLILVRRIPGKEK